MISTLSDLFGRVCSLSWLSGPIFEKELRVSSRRRRSYLLRSAYLALLTVFVVYAYKMTMRLGGSGSAVYQLSRMPEVGKYIVTTVVWFQFAAVQLIAIIMLSSSISEEIQRRTLGVLMTTPIASLQIVLGKLLSKLLQLVLLLAISMPLLAIVRVFGGVPWDYVLSSLCVTLTAAIFAGSVSLALSAYTRQAHRVTARTVLICFLLYAGPVIVVELLQVRYQVRIVSEATLSYANPFLIMTYATRRMLAALPAVFNVAWLGHCAIMAGLSASVLVFSAISVRRAALRQARGQPVIFASHKERRARAKRRAQHGSPATSGRIICVKGPPIVWKEMRTMLVKIGRLTPVVSAVLAVVALAATYGYCAYKDYLGIKGVQTAFVLVYLLLGLLRTATTAATSITSEREARTWPVLLATALTDRQIVFGKIIGSALQSWPYWLLLTAHVVLFSLLRYIPAAAILPLAVLVVSSALFVSAVGVLFSSWCRRSATAACANLLLFLCLVVPFCCPLPVFLVSPIFAALMILAVTGQWEMGVPFGRMDVGAEGDWFAAFLTSVLALLVLVGLYLLVAFAASAFAIRKVRRKIY